MRLNLTFKTFFSTYLNKPCSKDLSACQKALAVTAAVALTIFTAGLIFIVPSILNKKIVTPPKRTELRSHLIDSDMQQVTDSIKKRLQELGDISILSARCFLKTDFHSHSEQNNFTLDSNDLLNKLEKIQKIHKKQCKKLAFGQPIKTEWAWIITDKDSNQHQFAGDLTPPNRGTILEFGKSGSQTNFRI